MSRRNAVDWRDYSADLKIMPAQMELDFTPSYNIKPQQSTPIVVVEHNGECIPRHMYWGIRAADRLLINARDDRLWFQANSTRPSFWRDLFVSKRCLIFADGFYEPKGPSSEKKRPWYFFQFKGAGTFAFGGLWKQLVDEHTGEVLEEGFVIITTPPTPQMKPIHHRHPLILEPSQWAEWMDHRNTDVQELITRMVKPWAGEELEHWRVSDRAKSAKHDDEACIEPFTEPQFDLF